MEHIKIIKNLTIPHKTGYKKIRVGEEKDGGYILLEELCNLAECVVSLGIGDNVEFDLDFVKKFQKHIYMADITTDEPPIENENFSFKREFINETNFKNFLNHFNLDNNSNMILKMDIEGGEYDTLINLDKKILNKFSQITVEFHELLQNPTNYISLMSYLNAYFFLFHVHANNIGPIQYGIPDTIELSFVRKDLVKEIKLETNPCPDPDLDFSNHSTKKDYVLDWWC